MRTLILILLVSISFSCKAQSDSLTKKDSNWFFQRVFTVVGHISARGNFYWITISNRQEARELYYNQLFDNWYCDCK